MEDDEDAQEAFANCRLDIKWKKGVHISVGTNFATIENTEAQRTTENDRGKQPIDTGNYWSCYRGPQTAGTRLLETAYRVCLAHELRKRGFDVIEEKPVPVFYDEVKLECGFRADLLVNGQVVVELKAKTAVNPIDKAQALSHLRLLMAFIGS